MSNYVQSTNFATKDALPSGDPLKIVKGTEINTEFNNIATAVATKADTASPTLTSPTLVTPALGTPTSGVLTNVTGLPIVAGTTGTLSVARGGTGVTSSTGTGSVVLSNSPTFTGSVTGTFVGDVTGNVTGNAGTVTNGVYITGNQTIGGEKIFSSTVYLADGGVMFSSDGARDTGISWASDGVMNVLSNGNTVGQFNGSGFTGNAATATNATNATTAAACSGNSATATKLTTASGSAPSYSARAWVNFDGSGTVAIRASGNVSSITDNGTGDYTVNFSTAMQDADYAAVATALYVANNEGISVGTFNRASGSVQLLIKEPGVSTNDSSNVDVAIFR